MRSAPVRRLVTHLRYVQWQFVVMNSRLINIVAHSSRVPREIVARHVCECHWNPPQHHIPRNNPLDSAVSIILSILVPSIAADSQYLALRDAAGASVYQKNFS